MATLPTRNRRHCSNPELPPAAEASTAINFGGGLNKQLGLTDTVSWAVHGSTVSYSASTQQPFFDYTSNIDWKHNLSAATALTGSVSADWYMANDAQDSQRLYWNLMGGIQSQLTKRLFIYATAGVGLVNAWKKGDTQPAAPVVPGAPLGFGGSPFAISAGASQDWLANLAMNYRVSSTDTASLTVTRSIAPTIIGQLLSVESVSLSYTRNLDKYSSLNLATQFSHAEAAADQSAGAGGTSGGGGGLVRVLRIFFRRRSAIVAPWAATGSQA